MTVMVKRSAGVKDYEFDWSAVLSEGEGIVSHNIAIEPGGELSVQGASVETAGVVSFWLTGGVTGDFYEVSCQVTTNGGRTCLDTMTLKVI
jgi:hypothetical protein